LNLYLKGKKPLGYLVRVLFFLGLVVWNMQTALVLIFGFFAAGSFAKWLYYKAVRRRTQWLSSDQHTVANDQSAAEIHP
jgi:hypothetical protein